MAKYVPVTFGQFGTKSWKRAAGFQFAAMQTSGTRPTKTALFNAGYSAKRVTLSLALRSSGDAGRGFGRIGAAAALVTG